MRAHLLQRGLATVEFAIVGTVLVLVILAVIEVGRLVFALSVLQEAARRGARAAVVCSLAEEDSIKKIARFIQMDSLENGQITVLYLNASGADSKANFDEIRFVRVEVQGADINLGIPFLPVSVTKVTPHKFSSTLPRESLGIIKEGTPPPCVPE